MKWLTRASFSEHRWLGWTGWLKQVWLSAVAAGFASELILGRDTQALFDTVHVVLVWPLLTIAFCLLFGFACMRLWHVSLPAALAQGTTLLPYLLVVPLIQLVESEIGIHDEASFVGVGRALLSILSGGMLPTPVAPTAVALVWLGLFVWLGWSWWKTTAPREPRVLLKALAPSYFFFAALWIVPSLFGWSALVGSVPLWDAPPSLVERGFVTTQVDGYAWRHVYERFPLAIGGEAHISTQWLLAILLLLVLVVLFLVSLTRLWRWSWRAWLAFMEMERVKRVGGLVGLGFLAAWMFGARPVFGWTHLLAFLALVLVTTLFALAQAADRDLARAASGSLPHDRPLSTGVMRSADLFETKYIWRVAAYLLAWLLGWPVLVSFTLVDLGHLESMRVRGSESSLGWNLLSLAGCFLAGWMVVSERGSFGAVAPALAALICLAHFAWNWGRNRLKV